MGLGLSSGSGGGGDFNAVCKYNAKAGRMYRIDREQDQDGYVNNEVEITEGFSAVMDLANVEVGYAKFMKGTAPDWHMVKLGQPLPPKPAGVDDKGKATYKQTFRMMLKLGKSVGGDIREFASSAGCVVGAMDTLHTAYVAAPESKQGKLPVVSMPRTIKAAIKGGDSNYAPVFEIVKWVDRPADLSASEAAAQAAPQTAAPRAAAAHVEPPKAVAPAAASNEWDD